MIDIRVIRENPQEIAKLVASKGVDFDVEALLKIDSDRKDSLTAVEKLKAERNSASRAIGAAKKAGEDASEAMAAVRKIGEDIAKLDDEVREADKKMNDIILGLPNPPHASVPVGSSESDNVVVRSWNESVKRDFELKEHKTFGESLGLFDFERGAKISGSGFPVYTGLGARFERALISFFLDTLSDFGFSEVIPPHMVTPESMTGTGQLPKFSDQLYYCPEDDLYLIPTAEVPITNMHAKEVLKEADLPVKYCGYSPCFRREAGSYGKDVRGFLRLHQFNKVEMVQFVKAENSYDVLETMVSHSEAILKALKLPYRVLELCSGDLGFGAAKCYDLEVWSEVEQKWLEVSSVSNFEEFQSRRMNIKSKIAGKNTFVHTLNGSGLATPRVLVALLDYYQQEDGSFEIPEVLRPYMRGLEKINP